MSSSTILHAVTWSFIKTILRHWCFLWILGNLSEQLFKKTCEWLFWISICGACNFFRKKALAQVFSCEFCEIFKSIFFTEHHWTTASDFQLIKFSSKNLDYFIFQSFYNLKIFQNMKNINSWYGQTSLTSSDYEWLQPWLPIALDIKNIYRFLWLDSLCCTSGKNHGKILMM